MHISDDDDDYDDRLSDLKSECSSYFSKDSGILSISSSSIYSKRIAHSTDGDSLEEPLVETDEEGYESDDDCQSTQGWIGHLIEWIFGKDESKPGM